MEGSNKPKTITRHFFAGTYAERMDGKNRVNVPLVWRHILKDKVVMTRSAGGCLSMWTLDFFEYYAIRKLNGCTTMEEVDTVRRFFIGSSKTVDIDSKGRMWIPDELLNVFDADEEMYFIGVGDYIEVWSKELFDSWKEEQIIKETPEKHLAE
ncbi:division/cell wall cluster transcriptional repressor MraZ [Mycoplasma suis]|uniref:Transcriptional regulator MraZ n=2 Tax=Mycoplasma suis TaxID=57372 RepID=F0QR27_MYCSL|nr:cell division protein MraZ [Mycoplasma suis]ADX97947.1 cell division protein MraZ [Mycoplasma suis str. Illinois]CBZ40443.1 Cell division protein MraZ [Mycoplasma suis KI3806]